MCFVVTDLITLTSHKIHYPGILPVPLQLARTSSLYSTTTILLPAAWLLCVYAAGVMCFVICVCFWQQTALRLAVDDVQIAAKFAISFLTKNMPAQALEVFTSYIAKLPASAENAWVTTVLGMEPLHGFMCSVREQRGVLFR